MYGVECVTEALSFKEKDDDVDDGDDILSLSLSLSLSKRSLTFTLRVALYCMGSPDILRMCQNDLNG
jgi:hypothetical protein